MYSYKFFTKHATQCFSGRYSVTIQACALKTQIQRQIFQICILKALNRSTVEIYISLPCLLVVQVFNILHASNRTLKVL